MVADRLRGGMEEAAGGEARVFVGGLRAGVCGAGEVEALLRKARGVARVRDVHVVARPAPEDGGAAGEVLAFATVEPAAALAGCIRTYNGCRWKGCQLRVERAARDRPFSLDMLKTPRGFVPRPADADGHEQVEPEAREAASARQRLLLRRKRGRKGVVKVTPRLSSELGDDEGSGESDGAGPASIDYSDLPSKPHPSSVASGKRPRLAGRRAPDSDDDSDDYSSGDESATPRVSAQDARASGDLRGERGTRVEHEAARNGGTHPAHHARRDADKEEKEEEEAEEGQDGDDDREEAGEETAEAELGWEEQEGEEENYYPGIGAARRNSQVDHVKEDGSVEEVDEAASRAGAEPVSPAAKLKYASVPVLRAPAKAGTAASAVIAARPAPRAGADESSSSDSSDEAGAKAAYGAARSASKPSPPAAKPRAASSPDPSASSDSDSSAAEATTATEGKAAPTSRKAASSAATAAQRTPLVTVAARKRTAPGSGAASSDSSDSSASAEAPKRRNNAASEAAKSSAATAAKKRAESRSAASSSDSPDSPDSDSDAAAASTGKSRAMPPSTVKKNFSAASSSSSSSDEVAAVPSAALKKRVGQADSRDGKAAAAPSLAAAGKSFGDQPHTKPAAAANNKAKPAASSDSSGTPDSSDSSGSTKNGTKLAAASKTKAAAAAAAAAKTAAPGRARAASGSSSSDAASSGSSPSDADSSGAASSDEQAPAGKKAKLADSGGPTAPGPGAKPREPLRLIFEAAFADRKEASSFSFFSPAELSLAPETPVRPVPEVPQTALKLTDVLRRAQVAALARWPSGFDGRFARRADSREQWLASRAALTREYRSKAKTARRMGLGNKAGAAPA